MGDGRYLVLVLLVATAPGCDQAFGLTGHPPIDAAVNPDAIDPDPTTPVGLLFEQANTTPAVFAHLVETYASNTVDSPASPQLFQTGVRYRVRLACQGLLTPTCTATTSFGSSNTTIPLSLPSGTTRSGAVGLRVHGAVEAAFDYIVVYRGPE